MSIIRAEENRFVERLEELLTAPIFDKEKALQLSLEIYDAETRGYWADNYESKLWLQLSMQIEREHWK